MKENEEKGTVRIALPDGFVVKAKNNKVEKEEEKLIEFTAENFIEQVKGKTDKDYESLVKPTGKNQDLFEKVEEDLVENVPVEMKNRPNWVAVKTWFNKDKGRYEKRPINCITGDYTEADNPETWTDFETARKYAKENGYTTLAYALDGKDGICCIDLDGSVNEKGEYSPLAKEVLNKCGKTYIERSLSGKGLHVLGTTSGMDVRTFAKDNTMEFYQKDHFIAMTGDGAGYQRFENFDRADIKAIIENKCDKRQELLGAGKGVEGLSKMTDRDVVEKAIKSKGGETFKGLYEGQDLQNNHSNSDMSLMNRLAFWCNGDKEQMLRIFATSGLYRPNKSQDYYECTVVKAIRDTANRFQPSQNINTAPKFASSNGAGKGGK